jgi:cytochrome c oxidase assembly protein subunit 15
MWAKKNVLGAVAEYGSSRGRDSSGRPRGADRYLFIAGVDFNSSRCLAQTFFCTVIALAVFTSPRWKLGLPVVKSDAESIPLQTLCAMTTAAVYFQLILGALMRHTNSGLAIPDFPLSFGHIIPPFTSNKVIIHFAHRVGAVIVSAMIVWTFSRIARAYSHQRLLFRPALVMMVLVVVQVTLGAVTVWTSKAVTPTTVHVLTGALVLGTSFLLTLRAYAMSAGEITLRSCGDGESRHLQLTPCGSRTLQN